MDRHEGEVVARRTGDAVGSREGRAMDRAAVEERGALRLIGVAFGLSALASLGLTAVYALGGQPQVEGALLGIALGGLALGFVLWGKRLMPAGPFVEEREPMAVSAVDREDLERDLFRGEDVMRRRTFLRRMLYAAAAALGIAAVLPIRSLGPSPGRSLFRTKWRSGSLVATADGTPIGVDDLPVGGILTVFPAGDTDAADSQTVLIRVEPSLLRPVSGRETWSPEGYVAYSKICTHAGCPVGLYEQRRHQLFCPCHQSVFEVLDGARPTTGPATRALPQLPLEVDEDGLLRAQGDYREPVGPDFWESRG
jgi:ubiquinol-cytochrome c reductase iron-sulfur subunit